MGGVPEHLKKQAEATASEPTLAAAPTITGTVDDVKPTSLSGHDDADAKAANVKKILDEAVEEAAQARKTTAAEPTLAQEADQIVLEEPASTPRPTDEL